MAEDEILVAVVGPEQAAAFLPLVSLELQRGDRGLRQLAEARLSTLRAFDPEPGLGLLEGFADREHPGPALEIRPLQREQFTAARASGERDLYEREGPIAAAYVPEIPSELDLNQSGGGSSRHQYGQQTAR